MDYETLSSELIREMRGRRSQTAFSRRLGYRSNVVYAWESGRAWPTAAVFFKAVERLGRPVGAALSEFYRLPQQPERLPVLTTKDGVAQFLDDLRGNNSVVEIAKATQRSRFAISRWLKGQAEPRLPDFLRLVDAASLRVLDFISCFVDPNQLSSARSTWQVLESSRKAAYELPWSQAVLRVIELESYRKLPRHRPGFIADWLRISRDEEEQCIQILLNTGQVRKKSGRLVPGSAPTLDTRRDAGRARQAKAWWTEVALARMRNGDDGTFSYNLFSVSRADLERIQALHRAYFRELRRIVASSEPAECIALANVHLLELGPAAGTSTGSGGDDDTRVPRTLRPLTSS
jgi:transcriptional regulator with XRE-family HTH domain